MRRYMLLQTAARLHGSAPYLGERPVIRDADGSPIGLKDFRFYTFADVRVYGLGFRVRVWRV